MWCGTAREPYIFFFCWGPYSDRCFENPPKLVLLDLKLPKVDGMEELRAAGGDDPNLFDDFWLMLECNLRYRRL